VYWGATYAQTYLVGWVGQRVLQDLRVQLFAHLQTLSVSFYSRRQAGVIISRLTNDVSALDQLVSDGVVTLFQSTLLLVGTLVILFTLDVQLALITLIVFPILGGASLAFRVVSAGAYRLTREKVAAITAYLQETLSGVRVVRSFGQEARHGGRMTELNEENRDANLRTVYLNAAYFPAVELLSAVGTAVILLYGGNQVIQGTIAIGVMVAFVGYLQTFFDPIQQLSQLYTTYQQGMAALDKIFDLLDTEPDMVDAPGAIDPGPLRGEIEMEKVWFSYAEGDSTSTFRPARPWPWSVPPVPASRPSPSSSPASTTRRKGGCWSTATICAGSSSGRCAASSGSSPRRASSSPAAFARTSPSAGPRRAGKRSKRPSPPSAPPSSSPRFPTESRPRSASAASSSRPASASSSPSPGRCWPSLAS
jgi:ATP-binding cassette subfamily B protein